MIVYSPKSLIRAIICLLFIFSSTAFSATRVSNTTRMKLHRELPVLDMALGDEVLIRTFKKESLLELWIRPRNKTTFILFRTYPICFYSGGLGPKRRTGDKVTPEGFYGITQKALNPHSRFHLSMNIGYPNTYDRFHGRTGNLLMIHGACDAIGCFAMGNDQIEEIYFLVEQAITHGQSTVPVHAFPFRLTDDNLNAYKSHKWYGFWSQLKVGYDGFNQTFKPPVVDVVEGRYVIDTQY